MKKKDLTPTEMKKTHLAQLIEKASRKTFGFYHDHEPFGGLYTSHFDQWTFHPWISFQLDDLRAIRQSLKKSPQYFKHRELTIGETETLGIVVDTEFHPFIGLDSTGEGRAPSKYSTEGIPGATDEFPSGILSGHHSGPRIRGPERE